MRQTPDEIDGHLLCLSHASLLFCLFPYKLGVEHVFPFSSQFPGGLPTNFLSFFKFLSFYFSSFPSSRHIPSFLLAIYPLFRSLIFSFYSPPCFLPSVPFFPFSSSSPQFSLSTPLSFPNILFLFPSFFPYFLFPSPLRPPILSIYLFFFH
ncbi:unnamed protein product [Acanthosepion pharaonis]|uniref:Uncharacterized protein n=1 Tax=Acanthosepion pharaonis TaxID=158019 RepID=A0A812E4H8_ACAPH|nr:unnamed protein product [Sepia pharaonis]